MNIICNNCVGACIYRELERQYDNPFMWSKINQNDFINLVYDFDKIDLGQTIVKLNKDHQVEIEIPNRIVLTYQHYIYNKDFGAPTNTSGFDIEYSGILNYAMDKYYSRLDRMTDKPVFIFVEDPYESSEKYDYRDKLLDFVNDRKYFKILFSRDYLLENDMAINVTGDIKNMSSVAIAKSILSNDKIKKALSF